MHGGYTSEDNDLNYGYFSEMVGSVPDRGNILVVYFASKDNKSIKDNFTNDSSRFRELARDKNISIVQADKALFIEQIRNADLIYIRGGDTQKLKNTLNTYPDFISSIQGKTISGSSAGAYVLSRYYFTNSLNKVAEGLGCIPARVVCHYKSNIHPVTKDVDPLHEINKFNNELELILLKDYEWIVRKI